jgi:hypothetical protein
VPDLLETSSAWLEDKREQFMSRSVIYQRGNQTVQVPATIGRTVFALDDGAGGVLRTESRDYLIRTAHLVLSGVPTLPRRGDQVHEMVGTVVYVYEVMAPGDEPHFRFSDPYRKTLRVHTKQIDQENNP